MTKPINIETVEYLLFVDHEVNLVATVNGPNDILHRRTLAKEIQRRINSGSTIKQVTVTRKETIALFSKEKV